MKKTPLGRMTNGPTSCVYTGTNAELLERELRKLNKLRSDKPKMRKITIGDVEVKSKWNVVDLNAGPRQGMLTNRFRKQTVMFDKFHFGDTGKGKAVHSYKALAELEQRSRGGVAHVVISDPPYGMKAGGHTPFNCNMEKSKSVMPDDRRYGVSISTNRGSKRPV